MLKHSNCEEEIKSKNGRNLHKLNNDIMDKIIEYVPINNLLDTCKEFNKLKKRFLQIELDVEETVKLFKKDEYCNYLYSLIDNPKKQLILNISQYCDHRKEITSLDFIFNKDGNFDSKYLNILSNVYFYKFSYLSLNHHNPPNSNLPITRLNKEFLNFLSLDVNILIETLEVDNVKYDIETILNKKNIKIKSMRQNFDILCSDERQQYDLYQKLKDYSKKYSITLGNIPATSNGLRMIINKYNTDPNENLSTTSNFRNYQISPRDNKLFRMPTILDYGIPEISSIIAPVEENSLQNLTNEFDNLNFKK